MEAETQTVTVFKEVELTEDEKLQRAIQLVKELNTIDELSDELKTTVKNYKTRIDTHEMKRDELMQTISTGFEERDFRCVAEKNFAKSTMQWFQVTDDGELTEVLIQEFPLTPDQMQKTIEE